VDRTSSRRHLTAGRSVAALAAGGAIALLAATPSLADIYMAAVGTALSPDLTTRIGDVGPPSDASRTSTCGDAVPWTTTASNFNSWAIGNCAAGGSVYRTDLVGPVNGALWDGGHIEGGVGHCGFVDDLFTEYRPAATAPRAPCSYADPSAFQQAGSVCSGAPGDGCFMDNRKPCPEYANYKPWAPYSDGGSTPTAFIRTEPAGSNALLYRYRARYRTRGGVFFDMVRDRYVPSGYGNWVFVPDTCF